MKRLFLLVAALLLIAPSAFAVDDTSYPSTLIDSACTDTKDTVSGQGPFTTFVEDVTGGGANGKCDHDNRILTGPILADTDFGPFKLNPNTVGILIFHDADAVSNDTDTWRLQLYTKRPHEAVNALVDNGNSVSVEGDASSSFSESGVTIGENSKYTTALPRSIIITMDLQTATSWDGNLSWIEY